MSRITFVVCLIIFGLAMQVWRDIAFSQSPPGTAGKSSSAQSGQIDHGRYIVEEIAKCAECHTPRTEGGSLDRARWLGGASIWFEPAHHFSNWADRAPALAGLPGYSDEQMHRVLQQGLGLNGQPLQPPMHEYHMNAADSQAVIGYLRSLPLRNP
jgi:mono/diheme cytochrome c family protein